ncbi:uncharacterized protein LOC114740158 [Neltuma alba]|uniref:uncharacterized protein LOC114740158 n=1 Tax=Neltuma alba TaxID=207710 RepID=UPI0010A3A229|nr:uncharacterized protein LOC114740158 [Prosopis alba]
MSKVVGKHQYSFIAGRQSSDNIIIAQEVIHSMKTKRGSRGWYLEIRGQHLEASLEMAISKKIRSFMWLFNYGRAHSMALRCKRGLVATATCPLGCEEDKDSMYLLRSCTNASQRWKSVVDPHLWPTFRSLQGDTYSNAHANFLRAYWDTNLMMNCKFYSSLRPGKYYTPHIQDNFVKLEVDGSVLQDGRSGCGGAVWSSYDQWLVGFSCKLTSVPPAIAELLGILHGLQLCWDKRYRNIAIYTDCVETLSMIYRGC